MFVLFLSDSKAAPLQPDDYSIESLFANLRKPTSVLGKRWRLRLPHEEREEPRTYVGMFNPITSP